MKENKKEEEENLGMGVATVVPGSELEHYQMLSCPSTALHVLLPRVAPLAISAVIMQKATTMQPISRSTR